MRRIIIVVAILAGAAVAAVLLSGVFSTERQRERALRRFSSDGTVVRRSCGLGEAHVDRARWQVLSAEDQARAASAIASWCTEQGGVPTLTVFDADTRTPLARWNGSALEHP
jgi:hypothetical protein